MFQHCIYVLIIIASLTDSTEILPAFRDSILAGNAPSAVDMISREAILEVDSVIASDPERVSTLLSYFGLQTEIHEIGSMTGRDLLLDILSSPTTTGIVMLFGISPGEPLKSAGRLFVPLEYGFPGSRNTIYIEILPEDGEWKIDDFFETLPL